MVTAAYVARATGCPLYLVHMSSKEAAEEVRRVLPDGGAIFVETTPHYLSLTIDSRLRTPGQGEPAGADRATTSRRCGTR